MRVAAISDIHANLPALEAVLAAIDESEVDELWCLGDVVGYGADPEACTELVRERCDVCLVGNHDLAVLGAQASDGALLDLGNDEWLVNPGSVGQPRDGDPRAAWLVLDTNEETAHFHRVPYDTERAARSIVEAGLPRRLADRLQTGQ